MTETAHSPEALRASNKRGTRVVVAVAVMVGLLGAVTGEAKLERKSRLQARLVSETVPDGCRALKSFVNKSSNEVIGANTKLSVEECEQVSMGLAAPKEYLTEITKTVQVERELPFYFDGRDWGAEAGSRSLRFIIGAAIGALLSFGLLSLLIRRNQIVAALTGLRGVAASTIGQIQNSVTTTKGGTAMTIDSVPSPPQINTTRGQRRTVFDVRFNRFITPIILSIFYVICVVAAFLGGFVFWLQTISDFSEEGSGTAFITALWTAPLILIVVVLVCLLVRLIFESVMVIFRIAEDLRKIRDK